MAHAARRSRHALQSQVGGAGENRGEERDRIGVDAPGAQIGKRVEEPREGVHIPQQIGDPDARHQRIDRAVEAFARRRRERVVRRDFEAALLEPDAVEATGHQLRAHFAQPVVEPLAPACEPGRPVGVQCAVAQDALCVVQGHEIGVESTVVLAACHPDVAGAQPVTQRGDHRRFVDAPLGCGVVQDDRSPVLARKRHRDDVGEGAFARAVELPEERHGGLQVVAGGGGVELEGVQERRREAAQLCVALGRQRQRVLRGQISQRGDLRDYDPEEAALGLRMDWDIGVRPIGNLVHLLEAKGVRVFSLAERGKQVDAYSLMERRNAVRVFEYNEDARTRANGRCSRTRPSRVASPRGDTSSRARRREGRTPRVPTPFVL